MNKANTFFSLFELLYAQCQRRELALSTRAGTLTYSAYVYGHNLYRVEVSFLMPLADRHRLAAAAHNRTTSKQETH
jgi:hypothetical protein